MPERNIQKEKEAVDRFIKSTGRKPSSDEDWASVHRRAYTQDTAPEQFRASFETSASSSPNEIEPGLNVLGPAALQDVAPGIQGLPQTAEGSNIDTLRGNVDIARTNKQNFPGTYSAIKVLEDAVKEKSKFKDRGIGESKLFEQAGIEGMGALSSSLSATRDAMRLDRLTFENVIGDMAGMYREKAQKVAEQYDDAMNEYSLEATRLQGIYDQAQGYKNQLDLLKEKDKVDREYLMFQRNLEGGAVDPITGEVDPEVFLPQEQEQFVSPFGTGVVTGYGSKLWANGLDVVLEGGKGAPITLPFDFEVIEAGPNREWGNQVVLKTLLPNPQTGELENTVVMLSHLDNIDVQTGKYKSGQTVGTQGNSGATYSMGGGDGTHLDVTVKKPSGGYYSPQEVAQIFGLKRAEEFGGVQLSPEQRLQAKNLSVELFGQRAGTSEENVNDVLSLMQSGLSVDKIKEQLKASGYSTGFTGSLRDAAESISVGLSDSKADRFMDSLDRFVENENVQGAYDLVKKVAIDTLTADEAKLFRGNDRTLELISDIQNDLIKYEQEGGDTNIFKGKTEDLAEKVGTVRDPELRTIATKIAKTIQSYRKAMSGAAFTESEAIEYKRLFPGIDKVGDLNSALIQGLQEVLDVESRAIMEDRIGSGAYEDLFGEDFNISDDPQIQHDEQDLDYFQNLGL